MLDRKLLAGLLATAALLFTILLAPSARAGVLVESAPDCEAQSLTNPFTPWLDYMHYQEAPDGGFESGANGWDLSGNAVTVAGNESHYVRSEDDSRSLALPPGSSATSPTVCVGLEHPTLRFFSKKVSGSNLLSAMSVEVITETQLGLTLALPIGVVTPTSGWQPTLPMPVVANLLPLLPGEHTPVRFRFTPVLGSWQIDDVFVDPRRNS
jgi:hypothetical protein